MLMGVINKFHINYIPVYSVINVCILFLIALQRSSSKTSLYASRSSLYSRRRESGRGERFESCADSLASYAHDDIDYYRRSRRSYNDYDDDDFGGYEKPISRNDRLRMSRSDHDLGRAMKEISTQTLRYNDVFEDDL
jgi:hypothetical protein